MIKNKGCIKNEVWKGINGYEGIYGISNMGRVRSIHAKYGTGTLEKPRIKRPSKNSNGYLIQMLYRNGNYKAKSVHRLVAEHFIPNLENKPLVLHKNDIKDDNRVDNLYWGTHSDNEADKGKNGIRQNIGQSHGMSKLTRKQVIDIKRRIHAKKEMHKDIAEDYDVSRSTISDIAMGRSWSHVEFKQKLESVE